MTFRTSLARYVQGLLSEETSTPNGSHPPTQSPESIPPTTTADTKSTPATLEAGLLGVVLQTMKEMQSENLREIRGMVSDILQGREITGTLPPTSETQPSRMSYDPPDYDDPGVEDLSGGIQAILEREQQEQQDVRLLRTEQEVLAHQLDEARAALMDPQGPDFGPS